MFSLSDFHECSIVIWYTQDYRILTQVTTEQPIHSARWHPFKANELLTVGRNRSVCFWYLNDELLENMHLEVIGSSLFKHYFNYKTIAK